MWRARDVTNYFAGKRMTALLPCDGRMQTYVGVAQGLLLVCAVGMTDPTAPHHHAMHIGSTHESTSPLCHLDQYFKYLHQLPIPRCSSSLIVQCQNAEDRVHARLEPVVIYAAVISAAFIYRRISIDATTQ